MYKLGRKIRLFISTYGAPRALHDNLDAVHSTLKVSEIIVINNHKDAIDLAPTFRSTVKIIDNRLRHPNSKGHLARTWNQCLLLGFGNLADPEVDFVLGLQDDLIVKPTIWEKIDCALERFDCLIAGPGDQCWVVGPEAVRKIGMWDEHFVSTTYQEADYYHRAYILNHERAVLEDALHEPESSTIRLNPIGLREQFELPSHRKHAADLIWRGQWKDAAKQFLQGPNLRQILVREEWKKRQRRQFNQLNRAYFQKKWDTALEPHHRDVSRLRKEKGIAAPETFNFYPWFMA